VADENLLTNLLTYLFVTGTEC